MIILKPFELLLSAVFNLAVNCTGHYGASLLLMSLVITLLTTPIYLLADKWSADEKRIQDAMKPEIDSIKAVYSGQKQFYLIQTTHRIHHYKFFYPLRSMLGILFQIPFFFAAYNVLSSYSGYAGVAWGRIVDLGMPDNLLFGINFLPILMTFFNIISSFYYTKSFKLKDNKQQIILALVFLLLLYDSPSALLIYWTSNNFLSLIKNMILGKKLLPAKLSSLKVTKKAITSPSILFFLFDIYFFVIIWVLSNTQIFKYIALLQSALLFAFLFVKFIKNKKSLLEINILLSIFAYFLAVCIYLFGRNMLSYWIRAVLLEVVLLFVVISIYTKECIAVEKKRLIIFQAVLISLYLFVCLPLQIYFSNKSDFSVQFGSLLVHNLLLFVIAFIVFLVFSVLNRKNRLPNVLCIFVILLSLCYSNLFKFDAGLLSGFTFQKQDAINIHSLSFYLKDVIIILLIYLLSVWFVKKYSKYLNVVLILLCLMSTYTITSSSLKNKDKSLVTKKDILNNSKQELQKIPLSRSGKNLMIVVADMMNGDYVDRYFEENPDKKEVFSGFINFTDCIPITSATLNAVPSIYDGKNFSPQQMNDNDLEWKEEQVLAMKNFYGKLMSNEYNCFNINKHSRDQLTESEVIQIKNSEKGSYTNICSLDYITTFLEKNPTLKIDNSGDIFLLSILPFYNMMPYSCKKVIYDNGNWNNPKVQIQNMISSTLLDLSFLDLLSESYDIQDNNENNMFLWWTDFTHDPYGIKSDGTFPKNVFELSGDSAYNHTKVFLDKIGSFITYLKTENIYDNTFFVIISDHGNLTRNNDLCSKGYTQLPPSVPYKQHLSRAHSALLYKNFESEGELENNTSQVQSSDLYLILDEYLYKENYAFSSMLKSQEEQNRTRLYKFCDTDSNDYYQLKRFAYYNYKITGPMNDPKSWEYIGYEKE